MGMGPLLSLLVSPQSEGGGHSVYVCAYERVFHAPSVLDSAVKGPGLPLFFQGWGLKNTQEDP